MKKTAAVFLTSCLMAVATATTASAMPAGLGKRDSFGVAPVSNQELSKIRGGFIAPGGLVIDFALSNQTIINGELLNEISINSAELTSIDVKNLQQFIQIGQSNDFGSLDEILGSAGLVTVIQNTLDETVIQTISSLDVTVENFNEYQNSVPLNNALDNSNLGLR